MMVGERNREIVMMAGRIKRHGHDLKLDGLCLRINDRHEHQATRKDLHAFLSGFLAAVETYEWRAAKRKD
jgi:hypothetical protein